MRPIQVVISFHGPEREKLNPGRLRRGNRWFVEHRYTHANHDDWKDRVRFGGSIGKAAGETRRHDTTRQNLRYLKATTFRQSVGFLMRFSFNPMDVCDMSRVMFVISAPLRYNCTAACLNI